MNFFNYPAVTFSSSTTSLCQNVKSLLLKIALLKRHLSDAEKKNSLFDEKILTDLLIKCLRENQLEILLYRLYSILLLLELFIKLLLKNQNFLSEQPKYFKTANFIAKNSIYPRHTPINLDADLLFIKKHSDSLQNLFLEANSIYYLLTTPLNPFIQNLFNSLFIVNFLSKTLNSLSGIKFRYFKTLKPAFPFFIIIVFIKISIILASLIS